MSPDSRNPPIASTVDRASSPGWKRRTVAPAVWHWRGAAGTRYRVCIPEGYAYRPGGISLPGVPRYAFEDVSCAHDAVYLREALHRGRLGPKMAWQAGRIHVERLVETSGEERWIPSRPTRRDADRLAYFGATEPRWLQHIGYAGMRVFGWWWWRR